jgi:hypothetical protein
VRWVNSPRQNFIASSRLIPIPYTQCCQTPTFSSQFRNWMRNLAHPNALPNTQCCQTSTFFFFCQINLEPGWEIGHIPIPYPTHSVAKHQLFLLRSDQFRTWMRNWANPNTLPYTQCCQTSTFFLLRSDQFRTWLRSLPHPNTLPNTQCCQTSNFFLLRSDQFRTWLRNLAHPNTLSNTQCCQTSTFSFFGQINLEPGWEIWLIPNTLPNIECCQTPTYFFWPEEVKT